MYRMHQNDDGTWDVITPDEAVLYSHVPYAVAKAALDKYNSLRAKNKLTWG